MPRDMSHHPCALNPPCVPLSAGLAGERDFFEYVAESYKFFLAADDVRCEQVDAAKAAQFDEGAAGVQQELTGLQQVRRARML